jgi:predicted lipoprotein
MFRPKLLFTSLAALALGACSPQDPQAVTSAAIAKSVILPTYTRWVEADRQLAVSALAYCEGKESLDTARADFLHAQKAWAELQPLLIGPLAEGNRSWQVQFWPDKKKPGRPSGRATGHCTTADRRRRPGQIQRRGARFVGLRIHSVRQQAGHG